MFRDVWRAKVFFFSKPTTLFSAHTNPWLAFVSPPSATSFHSTGSSRNGTLSLIGQYTHSFFQSLPLSPLFSTLYPIFFIRPLAAFRSLVPPFPCADINFIRQRLYTAS